jgi:hypothetical protein
MSMTIFDLRRWGHSGILLATLGALAYAAADSPPGQYVPERFAAVAVDLEETTSAPSIVIVELSVNRWSSEAEKTRLARTLLDRGEDAFVAALDKLEPVGDIRAALTFALDVRFAWQEPLPDGGRRIVLVADGAVTLWWPTRHRRGVERFTVIELRLPEVGEGEGKVTGSAGVVVNRSLDLIELADYEAQPVRLTDVRTNPARTTT